MVSYFRLLIRQLLIAAPFLAFLSVAWTAGPPAPPISATESTAADTWLDCLTVSTGVVATVPPTAPQSDPIPGDLPAAGWTDQGTPGGQSYSLRGSLTVNRMVADKGDILTYTLILTNSGQLSLDATLSDRIPSWTTYVSGSVSGGASYVPDTASAGHITWNGPLAAGSSHTIRFRVTIVDTAPPGGAIMNTLQITTPQLAIKLRTTTIITGGQQLYIPLLIGD